MKIVYDPDRDIMQIAFGGGKAAETTQIAPGLILDYDDDGKVIGLEIRKASHKLDNPYSVTYLVGIADVNKPQPHRGADER